VWLIVDLAVVAFGLLVVVLFGIHAFARFRRMNRFGSRAAGRVTALADEAGRLGDRIDTLAEQSESTALAARR
jgi:hypothetical protein